MKQRTYNSEKIKENIAMNNYLNEKFDTILIIICVMYLYVFKRIHMIILYICKGFPPTNFHKT